jgi:hypothetical protein
VVGGTVAVGVPGFGAVVVVAGAVVVAEGAHEARIIEVNRSRVRTKHTIFLLIPNPPLIIRSNNGSAT